MALTFRRWIAFATIGAAMVWLALFHVRATRSTARATGTDWYGDTSAATLAGRAMTQAADRLRLLQIRDSVMRDPRVRRSDALTVLVSEAYGAEVGPRLDSLVRERWIQAGSPAAVRTVVAAVLDSSTIVAGGVRPKATSGTSIVVFVPDSSSGTCLAILRIADPIVAQSSRSSRRDLFAPETAGALLGPCLYYASFGIPGASVARWLRDGAWRAAGVTNWTAPPPPLASKGGMLLSNVPLINGVTVPVFEYEARAWTSTVGLECLAGQPGRCSDAILRSSSIATDSSWRRAVVSVYGANIIQFMPRRRSVLGPSEVWLLSEMVRTVGKDRFGSFWRSSEPLPDAFRSATGQTLDAWVHDWAVNMYGPLPTGPGLGGSGVIVGAVILIAGLTAAAAIARARRVS